MTLVKKTVHVTEGLAKLLGQYKDATNLRTLMQILLGQVQTIENDSADIAMGMNVSTAANYQLDIIGAIVGEPRQGRTDAQYRPRILSRIGINISNGHPDEVLEIMAATNVNPLTLTEYQPAAFELRGVIDLAQLNDLLAILAALKPAGVGAYLTYWIAAMPIRFKYDGVDGTGYDATAEYVTTVRT